MLQQRYPHIHQCDESERSSVKAILSSSFAKDPYLTWLASPNPTSVRLNTIIDYVIDEAMDWGYVFITDDSQGAALWIPTNHPVISLRSIRRDVLFFFRMGCRSVIRNLQGVRDTATNIPKRCPSLYLAMIGVNAEAQGRGVASSLLTPVFAACSASQTPIVLETANPRNVSIYLNKGFHIFREIERETCTTTYMQWFPPSDAEISSSPG